MHFAALWNEAKEFSLGLIRNLIETKSVQWVQGRINGGQRGQLPRALRSKRATRDDIICFK